MWGFVKRIFGRQQEQQMTSFEQVLWSEAPTDLLVIPTPETVRHLLDEIESITKGYFYEDPDPVAGPVEVFRMPEGETGGIPFGELAPSQMYQVFGDYVDWDRYMQEGVQQSVSFRQANQIFQNVLDEFPRSQWLDGTGLSEKSFDDLYREASQRAVPERDDGLER